MAWQNFEKVFDHIDTEGYFFKKCGHSTFQSCLFISLVLLENVFKYPQNESEHYWDFKQS